MSTERLEEGVIFWGFPKIAQQQQPIAVAHIQRLAQGNRLLGIALGGTQHQIVTRVACHIDKRVNQT